MIMILIVVKQLIMLMIITNGVSTNGITAIFMFFDRGTVLCFIFLYIYIYTSIIVIHIIIIIIIITSIIITTTHNNHDNAITIIIIIISIDIIIYLSQLYLGFSLSTWRRSGFPWDSYIYIARNSYKQLVPTHKHMNQ